MKTVLLTTIIAALGVLTGCATEPATLPPTLTDVIVQTTYDPQATFPKQGTFAFLHLQEEPEGPLSIEFAEVDNRIREALTKVLTKKGYRYGMTDELNYLISYRILLEPEYEMEILNPFDEDWKAVAKMKEHAKGALVVKVHKMPAPKPVWIGIFDTTVMLSEISEAEKDERVAYVANELMKTFPPK
ncbi:DUF4136 domain-containing protein [Planctomycetota bacterium]